MKKTLFLIATALISINSLAQIMTVSTQQGVTYLFTANDEDMTYTDNGQSLTIQGKTLSVSDISNINITEPSTESANDSTVYINYNEESATVEIAGSVARYLSATISGADVTITQADNLSSEITYQLSGSSQNGSFTLAGSYKASLVLNGLTLTSTTGAPLTINNGKRINIELTDGTTSTLTDATGGSQKACFFVKGHAEFTGGGTLNIIGNTKHAFRSNEYTLLKKNLGTINITAATTDGMHIGQYLKMKGGTVNISGVGDDGIQVSKTDDTTDKLNGQVLLQGGLLNISVTATAAKGLKSEGDMTISDGTVSITTSGNGTFDSSDNDAKGCAALKTDADLLISGGTLTLKSTGTGGKCIKVDGVLTVTGGTIDATSTGSNYTYNRNYSASAKAIKADGTITISGGNITATANAHEAIESKSTIDISGGYISATSSQDDAINSSSTFTISGGYVMGNAPGNDGLDANGNFYIKGGVVYAIGSRQPEVAIDANTEGGYKLYVSGGTIITCGPLEGGSSLTQSCYQASSYSANTWYALYNGSGELVATVKTPSSTSSLGSGMVVSTSGTPTLKSGVTVTGGNSIFGGMGNTGGSVSGGNSVSLSAYTASGGMGGGGNQPGGPGGNRPGWGW